MNEETAAFEKRRMALHALAWEIERANGMRHRRFDPEKFRQYRETLMAQTTTDSGARMRDDEIPRAVHTHDRQAFSAGAVVGAVGLGMLLLAVAFLCGCSVTVPPVRCECQCPQIALPSPMGGAYLVPDIQTVPNTTTLEYRGNVPAQVQEKK